MIRLFMVSDLPTIEVKGTELGTSIVIPRKHLLMKIQYFHLHLMTKFVYSLMIKMYLKVGFQ